MNFPEKPSVSCLHSLSLAAAFRNGNRLPRQHIRSAGFDGRPNGGGVRMGRRNRGGAAFTLVEMLVVIAIMALLVSLIFAGASSTMRSAKMTRCKSNLGQVGKAALVYANDHGGRFFTREGIQKCIEEGMDNREVIPYFIKGAGFDDIEVMQDYIPDGIHCPFVAPVAIFGTDKTYGRMLFSYSIYAGWQLASGQERMRTPYQNMTYNGYEFDILAADMFIDGGSYAQSSHPLQGGRLITYPDGSSYRGDSLPSQEDYQVKLNFCRKDGSVVTYSASDERLKRVPRKFNFSTGSNFALLPAVKEK